METLKRKLKNYLLKRLFKTTERDYIFENGKGIITIGGYEATKQQLQRLREECIYLKQTDLWKIFYNTVSEIARKTMFESSTKFEDMVTGKSMLYNLEILNNLVQILGKKPEVKREVPIQERSI